MFYVFYILLGDYLLQSTYARIGRSVIPLPTRSGSSSASSSSSSSSSSESLAVTERAPEDSDIAAMESSSMSQQPTVSYPLPECRVNMAMKFGPDIHMEMKLQEEMAKSELRFLSHRLEDRLVSEMKEYDIERATAGPTGGAAGRGALKRKLEEKSLSPMDATPWWEREVCWLTAVSSTRLS